MDDQQTPTTKPKLDIEALLAEPKTLHQMAQESGLSTASIRKVIKNMHMRREVYVAKWLKDSRGRDATPFYMLGEADDAPREVKSKRDMMAAKRARDKALEMQHD